MSNSLRSSTYRFMEAIEGMLRFLASLERYVFSALVLGHKG